MVVNNSLPAKLFALRGVENRVPTNLLALWRVYYSVLAKLFALRGVIKHVPTNLLALWRVYYSVPAKLFALRGVKKNVYQPICLHCREFTTVCQPSCLH